MSWRDSEGSHRAARGSSGPDLRGPIAVVFLVVAGLLFYPGLGLSGVQAGEKPGLSNVQVQVVQQQGVGRVESCAVDSSSYCTITHGLGVKPDAVTVTSSDRAAIVHVPASQVTGTQYRVRFLQHNGSGYQAGAVMRFHAHYDLPSSTPDPTPTPTPSPTPTSGPSPVKTCTNPNFTTVSTNNIGDGRTYDDRDGSGEYFVHNNMWNNHSGSGPTGRYEMRVCDYDNWVELVTQEASTVSPGAVRAYPNVHRDYNDAPLSGIQSARFAATDPECAGCIYNVAFDVWIGNDFSNELMVWTRNWGQRPAGTRLIDADPSLPGTQATKNIGGHEYEVWKAGGLTSPGGIFTYVSVVPQKHGVMPLQSFFADLIDRNWIDGPHTAWQVDYGVETVVLQPQQTFAFTDFAITESAGATARGLDKPRVLTDRALKAWKAFKAKHDHRYAPTR